MNSVKDFKDMDNKEAQEYFNQFVHDIPNRLTRFGNGNFDLSPYSLTELWAWYIPSVTRDGSAFAADVSIYFAEVFRKHHAKVRWGYIAESEKFAEFINQPLLTGFDDNFVLEPMHIISVCTQDILAGNRSENLLYEAYEFWKGVYQIWDFDL